ncbi:hypothetical protein ACI782_26035 [Geodermatophilus sp. SYSU D00703]
MTEQPATGEMFVEGRDLSDPQPVDVTIGAPPARPPALDEAQRGRLAELADCLIPGGEGLPAASAVDVHGAWIDRVLAVRPDLGPVLAAVLAADGSGQELLDRVRVEDPERFGHFAYAIAGAYLINPRIRRLLGYPAAAPARNPAMEGEAEAYLEDGILDVVIARGPVYRPTPTGA